MRDRARRLARQNIRALAAGNFDAILTNAAGCGSTLKEYDELLEHDPEFAVPAREFAARMKDVNEFLAGIELNPNLGEVRVTATYQDSCHLAHGQGIRSPPPAASGAGVAVEGNAARGSVLRQRRCVQRGP